ncbi:hypothetical protein [Myxococcus sp. CA039A]|uniref:hypothetical protein n=1 Tax=Myxococcus sp. CA039A TaxID=2741737 RepID=UPI00157A2FEB|nr:hypothetical protein [Myxococcus sp. CA039A]NTX55528.1 hypothetical protein [Myxococcus sp. CA039A]
MSETPTTQLLALFQANDLHFDSAEDAWARAEHLSPLLGWVVAHFPDERAFQTCAAWLSLCAEHIQDAKPAAERFAQARSGAHPRQAHIVASKLGDVRNASILARKPAAAAFADAASHLAEVWAAVTTGEVDEETDPWARARGASQAMVTAWVEHQGLGSKDNPGRQKALGELLDLLRQARRAGGLAET